MGGKIVFLGCVFLLALTSGIAQGQTGDVSALFEQAGKYEDDANFTAAEAIYKQIAAEYPQTADGLAAQEKLAILYIEQDKSGEADAAFDEMVAVFSGFEGLPKAVDHVADAYRERKDYQQARDTYRYAVTSWPEAEHAADSQRAIALTSILLGDEPNSEAAINKLLSDFGSYPNIATVVDHLADDMRELKRYEQARRLYQHVVDNYPQADYALNCLGGVVRTSILLNDEPNAAAGTDRLFGEFAGRGGAAKAIDNIADRYRKSGRYDKARELYKRAVATWPTSRYAMESQKGYVLCSIVLADEPNAVAGTSEMLSRFANNADLATGLYDVAAAYERAGRYDTAKNTYAQVVRIFPGSVAASKAELDIPAMDILALIDSADDSTVQTAVEGLIADFSGHDYLPEAVLSVGQEYYVRGCLGNREGLSRSREDYLKAALPMLERVTSAFGNSVAACSAMQLAGDCYRELEQYDKALDCYQGLVSRWPMYEDAGRAQFLIGDVYRKMAKEGLIDKSQAEEKMRSAYELVLARYPDCGLAKAARSRLASN